MKNFSTILMFLGIISMIFGCGNNSSPSLNEQQKAAKLLDEGSPWGGTGGVEALSLPSGVLDTEVADLELSFSTTGADDWSPTSIDASGADDYFSTNNSTWFWGSSGTQLITLEDASVLELTNVDIQDNTLTITFEVGASGGRLSGIDGSYTLRLDRGN